MEQLKQKTPLSTVENINKIASFNYEIKDKEQNDYILDLIIYNQKISFEVKQSSDILNQIYKSEIGLKDLNQMCQKVFGFYSSMQEINEDFFKFLKNDDFIIIKKNNTSIDVEMIIPHGFKKVNLHFNLNLIQNKIEDNLLNLLNNVNEFKKYTTEKIYLLEKANSEKDIIIKNLNKKIENLINKLENIENILFNSINLFGNKCIKTFMYPKKIIYCLKDDAQIDISNYIDYNKKFNCEWFKPECSEELNDIIEHFYTNYKFYEIGEYCWIITYGVETDPNEKKVGGYPIKAYGNGHGSGDNNIPGKCNGSGFTAFRKNSCSFANPNYFKKLCNWDSSNKFSIICLQKKICL